MIGHRVLPYLFLALAAFTPPAVFAEDPVHIDPETAVALALRSNLGIESEQLGLEVKRLAKDTVHNYFYPTLRAEIGLSRLNEGPATVSTLIPDPTSALPGGVFDRVLPYSITPKHNFSLGASITASLPLSLSMIHGIRLVKQEYESGLISLETARRKLALDVKKTFYNLLVLEERIKLVEQNLAAAETRYKQAEANFKSGLVDEYTLLSAQVAVESIKPVIEEARNGYSTVLLSFKMLLGLDFDQKIRLSGSIDPATLKFDPKELSSRYLANRMDIQGLVLAGKITENVVKLRQSYLYPTLSLMYSMDPAFQGDPFGDSWIGGDWKQRSGMLRIAVGMGLDSFLPDSKTKNDIRIAEIDREKVRVQLAGVLQAAEFEVRRLVMALEKSENTMKVLELNVRLAEKANRMGQEAYRAGLKDYSQIETTEVNLQQAKLDLLFEKYNYLTGLLDLEHALNTSLDKIQGIRK
jgi:outer membrane protein TolC